MEKNSDDATAKFQQALAYALLPVSPSIAALHSARVKEYSSNSCRQCGCALHRGESSVRTIRAKGSNRAIQTTCLVCGWVQTLPVARGNAALFPRTRRPGAQSGVERNGVHETGVVQKPVVTPEVPPAPAPPLRAPQQPNPTPAVPKSRPKKKGGLQSMLERNKERQSREKQSGNGAAGGLSMFLNSL
ncbi:hypothetical protein DFH09DRAFT_20948 [Mycena vulgaris]|nr:hypothetical protein DFH09DRAFT_20948 [Mycena vulgaris]